jgi:hypothetical protein
MVVISIVILAVALTVFVLACCKVSGDCSREEEKRDGKTD